MAEMTFILVGVCCGEDSEDFFMISMFGFGIDFKPIRYWMIYFL